MRSLLAVGGIAAAVLAAAGAAAAAPIGAQDDRLTSGPVEQIPARLDLLQRSGSKVTRVDVLWSLVAPTRPAAPADPADPAYRWERLDAIVRGLADRRITAILAVYSAPPWAAGGRGAPRGRETNPNAPGNGHYAAFMSALATRYAGGYLPSAAPSPLPRIRHYEIWNEPNLRAFLAVNGRKATPARYAALTRAGYAAVKRANRRAIVIAGVGSPRSSTGSTGTAALRWALLVARSSARFDAYSQHVYPAAAPNARATAFPSWSTLVQLPRTLDTVRKRRGVPIYITEAGYTTANTPFRRVKVTPRLQAAYLRQIMRLRELRRPRYRAVIWFNLQDNPDWPGGLLNLRGGAKPSHRVFVPLARSSRLPADLRFTR
jgi:hypothetical protein